MLNCPHSGCQFNTEQDLATDRNTTVADNLAMLGHQRGAVHAQNVKMSQISTVTTRGGKDRGT